jgi:hypothetical protein
MKNNLFCLIIMVAGAVLDGCGSANIREANLGQDVQARAMTADYRMVLSKDLSRGDKGKIVCAEPSPDIARAVSEAVAQNAAVTAHSVGASEAYHYQTAQTIAQLGKRFATIQLLRDELYNQCLAYANGQLSESAYAMKQSRFDALAVTLLGIEMLSGDTGSVLQAVSTPSLTDSNSSTGTATAACSPTSQGCRGTISDQQALMVEKMTVNFLKDEQLTPSMIACVSYYDRNPSRHDNVFADYCEKLFKHRINFLDTVLELVKSGKIDPHEASTMENSFGVMTIQGRRVPGTGAKESVNR